MFLCGMIILLPEMCHSLQPGKVIFSFDIMYVDRAEQRKRNLNTQSNTFNLLQVIGRMNTFSRSNTILI